MAFSSWRTWVSGEVVTAAHMNQEVRDNGLALFPDGITGASWSPTLEATVTDASAIVVGRQYRIGAMRFVWARFRFQTGGSGTYFVTLPEAASGITADSAAGKGQTIGSFQIIDNDPPHMLGGSVLLRSSTTVHFNSDSVAHGTTSGVITNTTPRTWAADDVLSFQAMYPIA